MEGIYFIPRVLARMWKTGGLFSDMRSSAIGERILQCPQYQTTRQCFLLLKILWIYICCRLKLISPKIMFFCLKKMVFPALLALKVWSQLVFLLVFSLREGVQIGLILLVGGLKDSKTYAWLTHCSFQRNIDWWCRMQLVPNAASGYLLLQQGSWIPSIWVLLHLWASQSSHWVPGERNILVSLPPCRPALRRGQVNNGSLSITPVW